VRRGSLQPSTQKTSLSGILLASKQNYEEAAPFLYKRCTFHFEDFELSMKFLNAVKLDNLKDEAQKMVTDEQMVEANIKKDHPQWGADIPDSKGAYWYDGTISQLARIHN
jgi:predicted AAA+ superfamily ATPase